ncbi:MAG: hypothetical protein KBD15_01535 [Candidatus Magasanikbacteria bacterium]|jgi:hypothetical protein|nr:hypothetical protein [Candidatus Magasanikbacteria bacterium]
MAVYPGCTCGSCDTIDTLPLQDGCVGVLEYELKNPRNISAYLAAVRGRIAELKEQEARRTAEAAKASERTRIEGVWPRGPLFGKKG